MKKIFSILFALVLLVSLGLVTALPVLADTSPGWTDIDQVAAGHHHTVGLKSDGTVVAVGDNLEGQCDVGGWSDIDQVAAGYSHTVGVKDDGTVVAVGPTYDGRCDVGGWSDIDQIAAGGWHTVGVKDDGTVVAVGVNNQGQCDVDSWSDIDKVAAGSLHTVGLESDGTVVAVGDNFYGQCDVGNWTDIIHVAAGGYHTVGFKSDGTVVAVGDNSKGQCFVSGWSDIDKVAAGYSHTVGLKSDGTVVAVGNNDYGQCDVGNWTNIIHIAAGYYHTVGVRSDGIVVAVGNNDFGQCGDTIIITETVTGYGIVDAKTEADTEVVVDGTATVTVFRYPDNPGGDAPTGFGSLGKYSDVYVPDTTDVTEIEIRLYYTDDELTNAGIDEESLRPLWLDGGVWRVCSHIGVNTTNSNGYSGYMWAIITGYTTPPLAFLEGGAIDQGYTSGGSLPQQGCFVATAAYGTDTAKEIDILREFRDAVLLPNSLGAELVSFYYKTSPPIANFISQHEVLRTAVRVGFVDPIVKILNWSHALWSA